MNTNQIPINEVQNELASLIYMTIQAQLFFLSWYLAKIFHYSFIKVLDKHKLNQKNESQRYEKSCWRTSSFTNHLENQAASINMYCNCNQIEEFIVEDPNQEDQPIDYQFCETYKQLKSIAKLSNPDVSKDQIYEELLKPFRHDKIKLWDSTQRRYRVSYICRYEGCDKEFTKTWNLLDHVRMHEGIKPFACSICGKTFTQKGNLKKHHIVQHSDESLNERKKFRCSIWDNGYTERYNLMVCQMFILILI